MSNATPIAVTSRSFSKHPVLRSELLARYPNVKFNDDGAKLVGDSLVAFLQDCGKVIAGLEKFDAQVLAALPALKVISRFGVGLDGLDCQAMNQYGVELGWSADVNCQSVAELTLTFMLALLRNSFYAASRLKAGHWGKVEGYQLAGKTVGIIGAGHVGRAVINLLTPFHCHVLVHDVVSAPLALPNVKQVDLPTLIASADIITLHVPATPQTIGMINAATLAQMKSTAYLINTARGALIDQAALKNALVGKRIAGAALDVYAEEPPTDTDFLSLPNLICTPHMAGNSQEAELAMGRAAIAGLDHAQLPEKLFRKVS